MMRGCKAVLAQLMPLGKVTLEIRLKANRDYWIPIPSSSFFCCCCCCCRCSLLLLLCVCAQFKQTNENSVIFFFVSLSVPNSPYPFSFLACLKWGFFSGNDGESSVVHACPSKHAAAAKELATASSDTCVAFGKIINATEKTNLRLRFAVGKQISLL